MFWLRNKKTVFCYAVLTKSLSSGELKMSRHEISNNVASATIKASDQPAHNYAQSDQILC